MNVVELDVPDMGKRAHCILECLRERSQVGRQLVPTLPSLGTRPYIGQTSPVSELLVAMHITDYTKWQSTVHTGGLPPIWICHGFMVLKIFTMHGCLAMSQMGFSLDTGHMSPRPVHGAC